VFGSLIVWAAALALMPSRTGVIDRRLEELTVGGFDLPDEPKAADGGVCRPGQADRRKVPRSPKEMGSLRLRLVQPAIAARKR
jgi:hypothetical protein